MKPKELIDAAIAAMKKSYSPYSHFCVGAALLGRSGRVYTGCNIENAAYSPTVCAERCAFFSAVSGGEREFDAIAVVGGKEGRIDGFCPPCGVCRQVMAEFCNPVSFRIILYDGKGNIKEYLLRDLLPDSFGGGNI